MLQAYTNQFFGEQTDDEIKFQLKNTGSVLMIKSTVRYCE